MTASSLAAVLGPRLAPVVGHPARRGGGDPRRHLRHQLRRPQPGGGRASPTTTGCSSARSGLVRLWALSSGVAVPVTSIVDVGVSVRKDLVLGTRWPGTHLPGVLTAGTFRSRGEKALWMVGRNEKVLVIELTGEKYRHLVLGVEDPEAATEALRAALNRER